MAASVPTALGSEVWLDCTSAGCAADGNRRALLALGGISDGAQAEEAVRLVNGDLEGTAAGLEAAT